MFRQVRTRFAPSPTGGLHLGGVRTALYSYLYAKKHGGSFVLRIEDTDQNRFIEGAEQYIVDCLEWCGIAPDEGPHTDGPYAPYRQSERKNIYKQYALDLVEKNCAYYAFDTTEELEQMREQYRTAENPSPQYDHSTRRKMKNSLVLTPTEVEAVLANNTPYVIRILIPENESISFTDMIRGEISNDSNLLDDKVLLKADGMPTYHLAVVVDDYLMKITHAFRGEEWLPSAPIHIKLWDYFGWKEDMPQWAHLPLILKPDGHGKLSKRDGDRLGFPVFAMNWTDPNTHETAIGFKEKGFLANAFVNMLALLGWHSGEEKEIYSREELIEAFTMERVHKGGAKFDFEKAKYFNHEWIKHTDAATLLDAVHAQLKDKGLVVEKNEQLLRIIDLVKERCIFLTDFYNQAYYFYAHPTSIETDAIQSKWDEVKKIFFLEFIDKCQDLPSWTASETEGLFKQLAEQKQIKAGELLSPFRIMLVGSKYGPAVFTIVEIIGKENTISRIQKVLGLL